MSNPGCEWRKQRLPVESAHTWAQARTTEPWRVLSAGWPGLVCAPGWLSPRFFGSLLLGPHTFPEADAGDTPKG